MNYFADKKTIQNLVFPNRICVNPLEGNDALFDGTPSEITIRRYRRFAESGAGLIWFEAVAVCPEGRSNARQLYMTEKNLHVFREIVNQIKRIAPETKIICQLTHSGRFNGPFVPILTEKNPYLETSYSYHKCVNPIEDDYLDALPEKFEQSIELARAAGFDGVDIKACHKYLISELLSAYKRPGKYGGESLENRSRLLVDIFKLAQKFATPDFILCSRFGIYDGIPYPYGFGVSREDATIPDYSEPIKLLKYLCGFGLSLVNITMGSPYYNPYLNKPHKSDILAPDKAIEILLGGAAELKRACPELNFVSSGYTYLKNNSIEVGNRMLKDQLTDFVGYGRMFLSYDGLAHDILQKEELDSKKCCVACNLCSLFLRSGKPTDCMVHHKEVLRDANFLLTASETAVEENEEERELTFASVGGMR